MGSKQTRALAHSYMAVFFISIMVKRFVRVFSKFIENKVYFCLLAEAQIKNRRFLLAELNGGATSDGFISKSNFKCTDFNDIMVQHGIMGVVVELKHSLRCRPVQNKPNGTKTRRNTE